MKLSAPVYQLKIKAKKLKKEKGLSTLAEALNLVAEAEGYSSWSLLKTKSEEMFPKTREEVLGYLNPGDLMLLAARPGLGKTKFALQMQLQAHREGRKCFFFSLEYTHRDVAAKMAELDETIGGQCQNWSFDFSDDISASYISGKVSDVVRAGDLIVIDYLQLLDQNRCLPPLQEQVEALKDLAREKGCIILMISQVDRSFEGAGRDRPSLKDIRLPNPLDLKLFNKTLFLHDGMFIFNSPLGLTLD